MVATIELTIMFIFYQCQRRGTWSERHTVDLEITTVACMHEIASVRIPLPTGNDKKASTF